MIVKQMNPNLAFKVVPLPQLDETRTAYANFWAEGVNEKSTKKDAAWKFLKYLSSADVQKKLYANQSEVRPFGELYSRKDLANDLATDSVVAAYLQDAPYAKGSYMSSYTHDDGLNDQTSHRARKPEIWKVGFFRTQVPVDRAHIALLQTKTILNAEETNIHIHDLPEAQPGFRDTHVAPFFFKSMDNQQYIQFAYVGQP